MAISSKLLSKGVPLKDDRFPGGLRTGAQYLAALRNDGRRVFIDGEEVRDVTSHPAFAEPAKTIAGLFDIACNPANADLMTYASPTSGAPVNRIWQLPDSIDALNQRRAAIERWSEESLGYMGRTPDHVAGFFAGFAAAPQVLARDGNAQFADNALRIYEFLRDNDVYITYTIVPPQIDRSKPAHQQEPSDLYCGVVKERDDGIVIKGAQMLGTGSVFSDYVHQSTIHPMRPGDENHAISLIVPCNAPGLKIYSRRSYAGAASSMYDYPLATRFDETDSLVVYDNVFVPWEHVFVYKNLDICRDQWFETPAHILGNNQAQIRFVTKLRFLTGLAQRITQMNGINKMPPVQGQIADIAVQAAIYEGLLDGQIAKAQPNANGVYVPHPQTHYAAMVMQSRLYPEILEVLRELTGGGMIQLPSNVKDFETSEAGSDIRRYIQSPDWPAEERVKLLKLAWDAIGSEFASRHAQYEKFYAGAPFIVKNRFMWNYDFGTTERLVDKALAGYDMKGRIDEK
ncbi:MAG: 4-hydroxyphenylacetate 3-hydroxylase N-terminal domain-containing protein [Pseudomonadota bacterium]|nr:4-hydroxyphenylacetate 3-hydroxylase N-terminal domain-containing protein [Pseudomonadota bacterium]